MKKKKKMKWSFKYLIPGIIAVILLSAVFLSNKYITKQSVGSIYNIEEAGTNFDNIQIGDEINYEVNGYSDWQVIGKDEYAGTIDVVSKTNTEDLTLEYDQSKEYYENIFQETANKYVDNNYVISARTVNQSDLDYFNYDNDFWLNTINETHIMTSQGTWKYKLLEENLNYKMYVIPYVVKSFSDNYNEYNIGDIIEYSNNGVDRWVVTQKDDLWKSFLLIPESPMEIKIDNIDDNIDTKANRIINSFNDVNGFGNYANYGTDNLPNLIPNFLNQQTEKIYFIGNSSWKKEKNEIKYQGWWSPSYYYENGVFGKLNNEDIIYTDTNPYTLGYRTVIKLKVKMEVKDEDKKEISSKLQVGDNVKYEAKGYKNWKVLSIDEDNNTVDIISGGIVKNITLSGKADWDNYEDIIQREVDEYKNGEQAKKATTVTSSHLKTLKEIDKSILSTYWILSKNSNINSHWYFEGKNAYLIFYNISCQKRFKEDNYDIYINNIVIYADYKGDQEYVNSVKSSDMYSDKINSSSYTAGLRPIITLKIDDVKKLSEKEKETIEKETEKQEKVFIKEQESKNKNYKEPKTVDDSTSSTGNNNVIKSNDNDNTKKDNITDNNTSNVEKIVYKDKPLYIYGFIIFLMTSIIELIIILLLLRKIKR